VQRPDIHDTMARDIALLHHASGLLRLAGGIGEVLDFDAILDEVWFVAQEEMDFLMEAHHADEFSSLNQAIAYIGSPMIHHQYTTSRVLVMEYIENPLIIRGWR
ncbi:MAG: AarF/UbiB family protein, partial [Bianqueaceae bacterium]